MATRTYVGPLPGGRVRLPSRSPKFTKGEPLEVTDDEAALLGDEWSAPKTPRAPKARADESAEPTPGDEPTSKEP